MEKKTLLDFGKFLVIVLLIIGLGLLAVNQFFSWKYKAEFLSKPCKLCSELNPEVKKCIEDLNNPRTSFWIREGWSNPYAENNYSIKINQSPLP